VSRNPFAEFDDRRPDPPSSVPGAGIHRQVGSIQSHPGPAGRGWSFAYVGVDRLFAWLAVAMVAIGLGIWAVGSLLG
jgi:hypothetical protein